MNSECPSPFADGAAPLLTIGYGNGRSPQQLCAALLEHGVRYVIDVRSKPYSKFRPEFSKDILQRVLQNAGLVYVFMGDALGGMPNDETCYREGKVDYSAIREREWFIKGLDRLEAGWRAGHRLALLCAELEPERCHRSKLLGEALGARGIPVRHIDGDNQILSQQAALDRLTGGQRTLFDVGLTSRKAYRRTDEPDEENG